MADKRATPTIDLTAAEVPHDTVSSDAPPRQPDGAASEKPQSPPRASMARLGIAAAAGAGVVVLLLLGLWLKGYLPIGGAGDRELKEKVAALEKQVSELQSRPQPSAAAVDSGLAQRIDKIEATLKSLPPGDAGVVGKLAAADSAMKSLGLALTALNHRTDEAAGNADAARKAADAATKAVADLQASVKAAAADTQPGVPRADIEALEKRMAAVENQAKAAGEALARNSSNDNAARLALSAEVLRSAVAAGAPYADELAAVRALGGADQTLAPLDGFAANGAPTARALAKDLAALIPQMVKIAGAPPPSADFLAKLEANAARLVRVRPVNAPQGDEPAAVLARLEVDAANNDIAGALDDLARLPDNVRAPAATWIARAKQRQASIEAATQYAAKAARALRPQ
jgi:hypothetical protein